MVELHQQVTKETMPTKCSIPFSDYIMVEELPAHFRAPSHLPTYDSAFHPAEHIQFSSLFQHQFASSEKYQKSIICLFRVKQEDNETLRGYVQCFNTTIFEVPTAHQEVLVSKFTQGLRRGSFFKCLAKIPAINFLDVLVWAEKYMNLEDAWLVRRNNRNRRRENELSSSSRNNPLDLKRALYPAYY
ncbi:UNVERIFIED_CONTAM: hypothetical protein Slati_0822000 [Sesamum latifolium]|uniref:Retrotransposon gag domain-containing protein n=1 Tax=Sesamum latifolium TaxID=2727402 RepID=A0AAW2XL48_9LAMI